MKYVIPLVWLLAVSTAAQAKLTPYDGTRQSGAPEVTKLEARPDAAAWMERGYFQTPNAEAVQKPGRCTVTTFVFTKIRLAQACY